MDAKKTVKKILLNYLPNAESIQIKEFPEGYNNIAFDVTVDKEEYVVKLICLKGFEKYVLKQNKIRDLLLAKYLSFPIAKILFSDYSKTLVDEPYLIYEKLSGLSLQSQFKLVFNKEELYEQIGFLYGLLHSTKFNTYGELDENLNLINEFTNWSDKKTAEVSKLFNKLEENNLISESLLIQCKDFFETKKVLLDLEIQPCLCHGDASNSNILVICDNDQYKVSGLIDFEFSRAGSGLFDLFSGIRSFETKYALRGGIMRGYLKNSVVPENWEDLVLLYNWMENLKQITKISSMIWRNLSKEETIMRKADLMNKSVARITVLMSD